MNSIEVVSPPEKKAPQQAVDGPVLRVFTKEGNAYTLQHETKDYQQAMKQAEKFHDKGGKDILISEKDNPLIVHAKSNRDKDVDVGREIRPQKTAQGVPVKGPGEVVLASLFAKLPLDTKAFDAHALSSQEQAAKEPAKAPKVVRYTLHDPFAETTYRTTSAEQVISQAEKSGATRFQAFTADDKVIQVDKLDNRWVRKDGVEVQGQVGKEVNPTVANVEPNSGTSKTQPKEPDTADTPPGEAKGHKIVLDKTGYELPEKVQSIYHIQDGKFNDKETKALRFEDHGKKLSTPVEDRQVIAHMVEVAAAKGWSNLELKGTETFKQAAWLEAQSRGIETKGYKPNDRDLEQLEKLRQERGTNEKQMGGPDAKPAREQNEIVAATPRTLTPDEKMRVDVAIKVMEKAMAKLPEHIRVDALAKMTSAVEKGDLKLPPPKVTERAMDKPRPAPAPTMDRSR